MSALCLTALLVSLAGQAHVTAPQIWLSDHFFVTQNADEEGVDAGVRAQSIFGAQTRAPNVCRDHIRRVLVLTGADGQPTASIAGGAAMPYIAFFEGIYDALPKALQRMFCSISRLEVGSRRGGFLIAGITEKGAELSYHRGLLDQLASADTYYSWYEQIPWTQGKSSFPTWNRDLPHMVFISEGTPIFALTMFATAHAFGHLFDWAGDLTAPNAAFSHLTWHDSKRPIATSDFAGRAQLHWTPSQIATPQAYDSQSASNDVQSIYRRWAQSGFVSLHASSDPSEDFADSLAIEVFSRLGRSQLWLYSGTGDAYELIGRMHKKGLHAGWGARILSEKRAFLRHFFESPDLLYP